jgi:hypothetical protein
VQAGVWPLCSQTVAATSHSVKFVWLHCCHVRIPGALLGLFTGAATVCRVRCRIQAEA